MLFLVILGLISILSDFLYFYVLWALSPDSNKWMNYDEDTKRQNKQMFSVIYDNFDGWWATLTLSHLSMFFSMYINCSTRGGSTNWEYYNCDVAVTTSIYRVNSVSDDVSDSETKVGRDWPAVMNEQTTWTACPLLSVCVRASACMSVCDVGRAYCG